MEKARTTESNWIQEIQGNVKSCENFKQLQNQLNVRDENGILKCHGCLEHAEIEARSFAPRSIHGLMRIASKVLRPKGR